MRLILVGMLVLSGSQPVLACSGNSNRYFQNEADVVVAGTVVKQSVKARRVLKGTKQSSYPILWPLVDGNDECVAFLAPATLDKGVFFLKRQADNSYMVIWTAQSWKMAR